MPSDKWQHQSAINIILNRNIGVDPVTRGIDILLKFIHVEIAVEFWSQHISFLLVGIIIATSIRGFLNYIMKVFFTLSDAQH
jgi:hypothetical protein